MSTIRINAPSTRDTLSVRPTGAIQTADDVANQLFVVFLRHVPAQELRRNRDRQVHGFVAQLLDRLGRLLLDAALSVLDDAGRIVLRLLLHLLPEPLGVAAGARDDALGLAARLDEQLRGVLLDALEVFLRFPGVLDGAGDRLLPPLERREQRRPGELLQEEEQHQEGEDRPQIQAGVHQDQRVSLHVRDLAQSSRPPYFISTISRQKISDRIATPSSRNRARFVAPVICACALGWRAMPSAMPFAS